MLSEKQKDAVLKAVTEASKKWKTAFNTGDASGLPHNMKKMQLCMPDPSVLLPERLK